MPFVETLEAYSRALYLPLRGYVRRPFQFATEAIRDHVPKTLWDMRRALEHTVLGSSRLIGPFDGFGSINSLIATGNSDLGTTHNGSTVRSNHPGPAGATSAGNAARSTGAKMLQSQPSMIHFFTSPYFLLLCFMSIVMNRINAIVAPRNPHPLKLSVRFALKLPAFYLLMKSVLITLALTTQDRPTLPLVWMLSGLRTSYDESHALWLSFIAMGVSCTVDSFIANLHSTGTSEHTINMLEWAILFHFTPFGQDILIISLIQVCQLLTLQFLSLSSRGKNYRLVVTTFWGVLDLAHFAHAVYYRSSTYPSLQLLTRLPEVVVILMVGISMTLHALTYVVTGGNVRRQMFDPRVMPTMDEEYGLAVFKLGRACMEATRGVGLRNEVDAVVVPFGTILDRKQLNKYKSAMQSSSSTGPSRSQHSSSSTYQSGPPRQGPPASGFANEMVDIVETPGQRQQISRRRHRFNVMKAFFQSTANLVAEVARGLYNKVAPARFQRPSPSSEAGSRMYMQEYLQLRATIEEALARAQQRRDEDERTFQQQLSEAFEEVDDEVIYKDFLSREFTLSDDEQDEYDADYVGSDQGAEDGKEEEDEDGDGESDDYEPESDSTEPAGQEYEYEAGGIRSFGMRRRRHHESDSDADDHVQQATSRQISTWRALGPIQDFFLDTSFMSIFLSGRMQETPLTRSQHRLNMDFEQQQQEALEHGRSPNVGSAQSGRVGFGRLSRKSRGSSVEPDNRVLLSILRKYRRKALGETSVLANDGLSSTNMSPPPLAHSSSPEVSAIYSRMFASSSVLAVEVTSRAFRKYTFPEYHSFCAERLK
ncbi:hypothetical protein BGZ70_010354 [Mortierella alpina]|uniref:Uncharacterized protein n=1 Tax=Mortierella alpina TaxID=64518 RepID=A0A9P6IZH1_MORAP|nr:hypothetical protein BGZ70_010354 [Mortierella alpina]